MNMNFRIFLRIGALATLLLTISCRNEDEIEPKVAYEDGFLIANEGAFGTPNASVTFVSNDLATVEQDIYNKVNGEILGDVLQDIAFIENHAFLLLNNSNVIKVVDRTNFKKAAEITSNLASPRYLAVANNQIYVTNDKYLGAKFVSIYKAGDLSFVKKIDFSDTVERIVEAANNIFVQNATYGFGNKITYINTSSNTIQSEIVLPQGNINKIDESDDIVYAIAAGTSDSYLYQISSAGSITKTITLTGISDAKNLDVEDGQIYFTSANKVYTLPITATAAPSAPLFSVEDVGYFTLYGFNVEDGKIFTADANNFTGASKIAVYNTSGTLLKSFNGGIGTNGFYEND